LQVRRIDDQMAGRAHKPGKRGRDGDLELRAVIRNGKNRLHDGIEHSEIPVRGHRRIGIGFPGNRFGNPLNANVLRTKRVELSGFNPCVILEELIVPLGGLEGSGHELLELAVNAK
jgi:hypothetical protein